MLTQTANKKSYRLSLDTWTVIFSLLLTALVYAGVLKHVPW
jgi:hypothetical protein